MTINDLREAIKDVQGYLPVLILLSESTGSCYVETAHMPTIAATFENLNVCGGALVIEPAGALSENWEQGQ